MKGFSEEEKVMRYIRLVMEGCVGLKRIQLCDKNPSEECKAIDPKCSMFPVNESSKCRIKGQPTYGFSSDEDES